MKQRFTQDKLSVEIFSSRTAMGAAAAADIKAAIGDVLTHSPLCTIIFAAAPSQNEVLSALAGDTRIEWPRVQAFHMDEYIGLPGDAPQSFGSFLRRMLFDKVPLHGACYLNGQADPKEEAARYTALLRKSPPDIVVMGIGENGHIAFNDPPVAQFDDPHWVKPVKLDEASRNQQVHDGCFATLDAVPQGALTLTVPALMAAKRAFCIVPGSSKAPSVCQSLRGPIQECCPASILRRHPKAVLYLDTDSAALL